MTIVLLLVGLGLIVLGADWLVEGASSIARKFGVSEFVIGLTIVGFGTSCPELVVSLTGAFAGNADIAVGNVIGSNIFNVLFILGLTALLCPVSMTLENRKCDIPLTLCVTALFLVLGMNRTFLGIGAGNGLHRWEGFSCSCSQGILSMLSKTESPPLRKVQQGSHGLFGWLLCLSCRAWRALFSAEICSWTKPLYLQGTWA